MDATAAHTGWSDSRIHALLIPALARSWAGVIRGRRSHVKRTTRAEPDVTRVSYLYVRNLAGESAGQINE
jgi:hypothetical protein